MFGGSKEGEKLKDAKVTSGTTMVGDEAELARMGYKQELRWVLR